MRQGAERERFTLPGPLRTFLFLTVALVALCLGTEAVCSYVLHLAYPWNWPLTPPHELGYDLNGFAPKFKAFHRREFFSIEPQYAFAYPAGMSVLYWLLYQIPRLRWELMLVLLGLSFAVGAVLVARALIRRGLRLSAAMLFCGLTVTLSYPLCFEAKQGNLEFFLWLLTLAGLLLFRRYSFWAALCFCLAGVLKPYLLLFLGLHVARRLWRPFVIALILFPVFNLTALWLLCPDLTYAAARLRDGISLFQSRIILQVVPREIGFDHSLFGLVKRLWLLSDSGIPIRTVLQIYLVVTATSGFALFFRRIRFLRFPQQVLVLSLCAVLLPPVSYDYTLLYLYAPLVLFALEITDQIRQTGTVRLRHYGVGVLLALILAPFSELLYHGVGFGGQVRAVLLLLLLVTALMQPLHPYVSLACPPVRRL